MPSDRINSSQHRPTGIGRQRRSESMPLRRSAWLLVLLLCLTSAGSVFAAPPDVRLLIDVSGSMRQNDPHNLRIPALRLVTELLPEGSNAGVWLFAETVDALAPLGKVNAKWKAHTRSQLDRIHSRGLFTDIEQAITTAIEGWGEPAGETNRSLILLTDGLVDVAKEPDKSAASRERIINKQIGYLKALNIKVYVIALSDDVDAELMQLLAGQTGGWLESATDAGQLQRIFLRMLEQTATPTTVPLKGNQFEVDDQVSEFTLLAFHGEKGVTTLTAPDGKIISAKQPDGGIWRSEEGYDLVTLAKPKPGTWQLQGVSDPDNRVVVVTDLGMELGSLPNAVSQGEVIKIDAWLTDHLQPVTRHDLLQLVTASATFTSVTDISPKEGEMPAPAAPSPAAITLAMDQASSHYLADLDTKTLAPGVYQLQATLDGGTFKRQLVKRVKIVGSPLTIRYAPRLPSETAPAAALLATLDAEPGMIDLKHLSGYLLVQGQEHDVVIPVAAVAKLPMVLSIPIKHPGDYQVSARLLARSLAGEPLDIEPDPQQVTFDFAAPAASDAAAHDSGNLSWSTLALYLLIGNAILGMMLGFTWWLLNRSQSSASVITTR